jgi:hypothetical protein
VSNRPPADLARATFNRAKLGIHAPPGLYQSPAPRRSRFIAAQVGRTVVPSASIPDTAHGRAEGATTDTRRDASHGAHPIETRPVPGVIRAEPGGGSLTPGRRRPERCESD